MQTDAILLDAVCCVRWRILLHVVASCCVLFGVVVQSLKPVKLLSQRLPTLLLFCDHRNVAQQCWIHLRRSSNIAGATSARNKHGPAHGHPWSPKSYGCMGCILPTMHSRTQHCRELLHSFAHRCKNRRNNSQLVSPTMLRVATSVCAHLKTKFERNVILWILSNMLKKKTL